MTIDKFIRNKAKATLFQLGLHLHADKKLNNKFHCNNILRASGELTVNTVTDFSSMPWFQIKSTFSIPSHIHFPVKENDAYGKYLFGLKQLCA